MTTCPLIVICGPAGVGKTTIVKALLKIYPQLKTGITYTTRKKRYKTTEDKKMYYVSIQEFKQRQKKKEFLEWAVVHGDFYGTHKAETEAILTKNPIILNIDVQGATQLKKKYSNHLITIFLLPESREQIIKHLKTRGEMTEKSFKQRLKSAEEELSRQDEFDYQILNIEGQVHKTITHIRQILDSVIFT